MWQWARVVALMLGALWMGAAAAQESDDQTPPAEKHDGNKPLSPEERAAQEHASASPDNPRDVPLPKGYAPASAQPYLGTVPLTFVQLTAGLGASVLLGGFAWVPVLGILAILGAPLLEAAALTYAGDRMGPYRAALFWPVTTAYIITAFGALITGTLFLVGGSAALLSIPVLLLGGLLAPVAYVGAGLLVGGAVVLAGSAVVWSLASVAAPVGSLVAYHLSRTVKHADDDGTGLPRLLPKGKGPSLPFFRGGERPNNNEDSDDEEEQKKEHPGSTPVNAAGGASW